MRAGRLSPFPSCGAGVADEVRSWRALALGRGPRRGFGSGFSGPGFSGPGFWRPGLFQPGLWRREGEAGCGGCGPSPAAPRRSGRASDAGQGVGIGEGLRRLRPLPESLAGGERGPQGAGAAPARGQARRRFPERRSERRDSRGDFRRPAPVRAKGRISLPIGKVWIAAPGPGGAGRGAPQSASARSSARAWTPPARSSARTAWTARERSMRDRPLSFALRITTR